MSVPTYSRFGDTMPTVLARPHRLCLIALLLALLLSSLAAPSLAQTSITVANPSVEAPAISSVDEVENGYTMASRGQNPLWTISDYAGIGLEEYFNKDAPGRGQIAPDGNQSGYLQSYYLVVAAAQSGTSALSTSVTLGPQSYTFTPSGTSYQDYTFGPVTANGTSQLVSFTAVTQPSTVAATAMLDNVRVVLSAAPFTAAGLSLYPATVTAGSSSTGTVTLSSYAPASGVVVSLTSSDPSATVPASVTVPSGQVNATFPIPTNTVAMVTTANITATAGGVTKTVALTVTPVYLSNLTLKSTTVTGGDNTTGTVILSNPAPSGGVTVALHSNNSVVTVPATCTIAAGATQALFNVATTAVSASMDVTLSGNYNGWTQGDELSVLPPGSPSGPPPGTSFDMPPVHVAPGNGCAVVTWNRLPKDVVKGYNIYRTSSGITTRLTATPFASNYYPDTGLTNDTTTYSYKVAAVDILGQEHALGAPVNATPSSAKATLNWINPPSVVTDSPAMLVMNVSLSSPVPAFGTIFFIDGVQAGAGGSDSNYVNGVQTYITGAGFDFSKLTNGPHTVQFLGFADANQTIAGVTSPITIQVNNTISSFHIGNSGFTPGQGELCYVSATAPAGSTWAVQATSQDGTHIIRTWQGVSSLVNLAWDGKDASGNLVTFDDYTIQLTVQPPGAAPHVATPSRPQAAPNAAGTIRKTRPVTVQAGQPIALALVSIGASYYKDSNGNVIPRLTLSINIAFKKTGLYGLWGRGLFP
jgi:hypothetical protein